MSIPKPVVLCILDGWGMSDNPEGNAPHLPKTPTFDRIMATSPNATLITHGPDVGLPKGQMGNSEVGHTNIGAGRTVAMDLGQIDLAIEDESFFENAAILAFTNTLKTSGGKAHLFAVASDGGVHGHIAHTLAATKLLTDQGVEVILHAITDGRDVAPTSAATYLDQLTAALPQNASIGTVIGRYWAMDRDTRWDRIERAYRAINGAEGDAISEPKDALASAYKADKSDEFVEPSIMPGYAGIKDGDGLFMLNFRADRAREILSAFGDPAFDAFDVSDRKDIALLGMVDYSTTHDTFMTTAFPKQEIKNTLGEWVSKHGKTQFRLAETEKYPHVTFFLNGGEETPAAGEDRFMPKSPNVATYDLQPEMSAHEVTDQFVKAIEKGYDLIVVNYANPDMVGHTGDLSAAIAACEAVDQGLAKVCTALEAAGGAMILTADHGNCEMMIDPISGGPHTAHTTNLVPVALIGGPDGAKLHAGKLGDLAPTVLHLMGIEKPSEMTGETLLC